MIRLFHMKYKSFATDFLPERDGHRIFYHQFGRPDGIPVISFHGGPGGHSGARHAAVWDLKKYRVILFDQRGCGRTISEDPLRNNTPDAAIEDATRILDALHIDGKVIAAGASYGSTLALLFAEKYPARVSRICVASIFLARRRDVQDWMESDARRFYPDIIDEMERAANGRPLDQYFAKLLFSGDKTKEKTAMKYYGCLEDNVGALDPKCALPPTDEYGRALAQFKVSMHFIANNFFMTDGRILKDAKKIAKIPATIIHNRLDMCCPVEQAWALHKALPKSTLTIVPDCGHGSDMMTKKMKELWQHK